MAEDSNTKYLQTIYLNGEPYKLYDADIRDQMKILETKMNDTITSVNNTNSLSQFIDRNGIYIGPIKWDLPANGLGDKPDDKTLTRRKNSDIPYFNYEANEQVLNINFY